MKILIKQTKTYQALDGEVFQSEQDCLNYEAALPRHLLWCLFHKVESKMLCDDTIQIWEASYTVHYSQEVYEEPGFLRAGGYNIENVSNNVHLGYFRGAYTEVISHCVNLPKFWNVWRKTSITQLKIQDITKLEYL
jgi:hypothetical protein